MPQIDFNTEQKALEITQEWKVDLDNIPSFDKLPSTTQHILKKWVPYFEPKGFHEAHDGLFARLEERPDICAVSLTTEELGFLMHDMLSISVAHYIRAKAEKMVDAIRYFPEGCCMSTSEHIILAAYHRQLPNAMIARNNGSGSDTHNLVILPFLVGGEQGYLLVDGARESVEEKVSKIAVVTIDKAGVYTVGQKNVTPTTAIIRPDIRKSIAEQKTVDPKYQSPLDEVLEQAYKNPVPFQILP